MIWIFGFIIIVFILWAVLKLVGMNRMEEESMEDDSMKITSFAKKVTVFEGKKIEVNIAQVNEILKVANDLLDGKLYRLIKKQR